jgi:hypothetical protein
MKGELWIAIYVSTCHHPRQPHVTVVRKERSFVAEANRGKELQLEFCEVTLILGMCTIVTQRGKREKRKEGTEKNQFEY